MDIKEKIEKWKKENTKVWQFLLAVKKGEVNYNEPVDYSKSFVYSATREGKKFYGKLVTIDKSNGTVKLNPEIECFVK